MHSPLDGCSFSINQGKGGGTMENLSEQILFAETQTCGHHTISLIARCFAGRLNGLTDEAKAVMRKELLYTSPRTIEENEALKACGG
jgi:hypothetical protein